MSLTIGNNNKAICLFALRLNKDGNSNIAVGDHAGENVKGSNNVDIGKWGREK